MPGLAVFQDSPDSLKSLQYGHDGTSAKVLKLDNSGRQLIATDVGETISVEATDLDIRNLTNTQDNLTVYGNDGTSNRVLKTDASGRVIVINDTGQTVAVSATDLDIRNLSNTQDNIVIYGNDGTDNQVLKTDTTGVLQVRAAKTFTNLSQDVSTTDTPTGSTSRDISLQNAYSFFVLNTGANSATVKVQISPDGTVWIDDSAEFTVAQNESKVLSVNKFAQFARVNYVSTATGQTTDLTIIYQSQT